MILGTPALLASITGTLRNTTFVGKQTLLHINSSDIHHGSNYSHHQANLLKYRHVKSYKNKMSCFNLLTIVPLDGVQLLLVKSNNTMGCHRFSHTLRFTTRGGSMQTSYFANRPQQHCASSHNPRFSHVDGEMTFIPSPHAPAAKVGTTD
jgi:hypothetical protein